MRTIDIREGFDSKITSIIFGIDRVSLEDESVSIFGIKDGGDYVSIYKSDIDNLIKALEKAKELWT